ncbi:MAG: acyl-CoA dehydrogenase family protein [Porticoccaceae bacterium]|jgi:alkylation response protein AidB-like acyl-CoA dehydrogenase|nr:acyl-CoA dehydrogenase family protein [Porticoccaceae bacterium]MBT6691847.1 acyl-CoA dehydrogenase family protein [Porticoccaceae bacterium]MBT6797951.1 acyl-CoA dehydrogenase family protein [Porticoccaceae bacterium]MBT7751434.1 acyl-CoA dehydrogenase family protein [Porticoccaceae bacterium]MBT7963500.1 acyl-CoA dehydrogenase family protein [Porticoccaceae bacterium]
MALVLNEEQQMLKESAQGFLAEHAPVSELRTQRDAGNKTGYSSTLWPQMVNMGWAAILVPEEYGGLAFGHVGMAQIVEQSGRTLTASPLLSTAILGVTAINLAGSEEQKTELLGAIAGGELTIALAVDEKTHHDPMQIAMSAERKGEGYVINGEKRFVVDGSTADTLIVATRTAESPGDMKGISLFLVDRNTLGINVDQTQMIDGRSAAIVTFTDVEVGLDALLGEQDKGFRALSATLDAGNAHLAAELLGIAQESFDRTLQYMKERKQFGALIGSFQALQHRAAHWWSEIELCKSVVLKSLQALDEGDVKSPALASIAKAKLCEVAELSTNEAIQIHGGIGMTDEYEIGFFIKRARPAQMLYGDYNYHANRFALLSGY